VKSETSWAHSQVLEAKLSARKADKSYRELRILSGLIDLCSNDYLGLGTSSLLRAAISSRAVERNGSGGSRLLFGNSSAAQNLEHFLARFHNSEAALLFNSGYNANLGLFSALGQKGSSIIYDQLAHASIRDGIRLGLARAFSFRHNDLSDLKKMLLAAKGETYVVVESLYSMDGDLAPLKELAALKDECDFNLIVDEAHATGVFGLEGRGLVSELGLEEQVFARVHTFSKALGVHGAAVFGPKLLINYLINFSRPFIYSTALPEHALYAIEESYKIMRTMDQERHRLKEISAYFNRSLKDSKAAGAVSHQTPIKSLLFPGNERARSVAAFFQEQGFDLRAVLSPTVPEGEERVRICLHAFNTDSEITKFCSLLKELDI